MGLGKQLTRVEQRPRLAFGRGRVAGVRGDQLGLAYVSGEEVHLGSGWCAHVGHFATPPLELDQYDCFQSVSDVAAPASIEHPRSAGHLPVRLPRVDHSPALRGRIGPDRAHGRVSDTALSPSEEKNLAGSSPSEKENV